MGLPSLCKMQHASPGQEMHLQLQYPLKELYVVKRSYGCLKAIAIRFTTSGQGVHAVGQRHRVRAEDSSCHGISIASMQG